MFQKKLQQEQIHAAANAAERQDHLVERTGLLSEVEPKLKSLAKEVFAVLEEAGIQPVPVWPMSPYVPNHLAFALAPLVPLGRLAQSFHAAVVVDCQGMVAFRHPVTTSGEHPHRTPISTERLDTAFEQILSAVVRTETATREGVFITASGELLICTDSGSRDLAVYDAEPLEDFLARHAAKTIAGT